MSENYWIMKLRPSTLRRIRKRAGHNNITITYIESTPAADRAVKQLDGFEGLTFRRVEATNTPIGPRLYLADVRNGKGEVITIDVFHQVLALRGKILEQLMEDYKDFHFMQRDPAELNMIAAFLGVRLAENLTSTAFIANYARWTSAQTTGDDKSTNILVIPKTEWSGFLKQALTGDLMDEVIIDGAEFKKSLKPLLQAGVRFARGMFKGGLGKYLGGMGKNKPITGGLSWLDLKKAKIMATYAMGLFDGKRNDISYYHAAGLTPDRMAFYFRYNDLLPSQEEQQWLQENRVTCVAASTMKARIPGVPKWKPSPRFKTFLNIFYGNYIKTTLQALRRRKPYSLWVLDKVWEMGKTTVEWKDFFSHNQVGIVVHQVPAVNNFLPNLAMSEIGGISCLMERSILFDYCTYIHNSPNHLSFVTGPYSLTQIPEPTFSAYTVQTGALNVGDASVPIEGYEALRGRCKVIVGIFDEMPNDWFFGDSVEEMYLALVELARRDSRFGLLIKTKKPQVLERLEKVNRAIVELEKEGKCLIADWKVTAFDAAAHSDVAVLVPSTVAFESVLTRTRVLLYNPMRSGSKLFYTDSGLNRRVFEDAPSMVSALVRYAEGKDDSVGDCSVLYHVIDPYEDRKGAGRMGHYLKHCLDGFAAGKERAEILSGANDVFTQQWGEDKITHDTSYEAYLWKQPKKN